MVCVPRPAGELRFAWGLILLLALPLAAHGQMGWRFWTAADGMAESYSQSVGIAPDGTAWIRHGQVSTMSVLNGYSVSQIAEPRATREVRSEEHTSELQSLRHLVCRLLLEKKKTE